MEETYISGELAAHLLGVSRATLERHKLLEKHYRTEGHARTGELRPVVRYAASELVARQDALVTDVERVRLMYTAPNRVVSLSKLDAAHRNLGHANVVIETLQAEVDQAKLVRDVANEALGDLQTRVEHLQKVCDQKSDFAAKQAAKLLHLDEALRISESRAHEGLRREMDARFLARAFATIAAIQAVGAAIVVALW